MPNDNDVRDAGGRVDALTITDGGAAEPSRNYYLAKLVVELDFRDTHAHQVTATRRDWRRRRHELNELRARRRSFDLRA